MSKHFREKASYDSLAEWNTTMAKLFGDITGIAKPDPDMWNSYVVRYTQMFNRNHGKLPTAKDFPELTKA